MDDFMEDLLLDIGFPEELIKDIFDCKLYKADGWDGGSLSLSMFISRENYSGITYTSPEDPHDGDS